MKKLLLIRPRPSWKWYMPVAATEFLAPPVSLTIVAALTSSDFDVKIVDEYVEDLDFSANPDIVGISIQFTYNARRAYHIADIFRRKGAKVVMGGIHASLVPNEALEHADGVVIGEAEDTWPKVMEDYKHGNLNGRIYRSSQPKLDVIPSPRYDLLKRDAYMLRNAIQVSRGCPFNCDFCPIPGLWGRKPRLVPVHEAVSQIKLMVSDYADFWGREVYFLDDNIGFPPEYWKELLRALVPLRITWMGETSVVTAKDEELLDIMAESGCRVLMFGFESISKDNLKSVNKLQNLSILYEDVVERLHKRGIAVWAFFIFGFDYDNEETIEKTLDFAQNISFDLANFAILTHYPGTLVYERDKEKLVHPEWWLLDRFVGVDYNPRRISREKLWRKRLWAYRKFYSDEYISQRMQRSPNTMQRVFPAVQRIKKALYDFPYT